jgi:hypothetical protein
MLSAIVTLVLAEAVAIVPLIPFCPKYAKVPALVSVTDAVVPDATVLFTVIVQTVVEV